MVKRADQFARGRVPEFGGCVRARRQDLNPVRTKHRIVDCRLMSKGGDQFARGRVPEFGGCVRARRQDLSAVWTKNRIVDCSLMRKGGDQLPEVASQSLAVLSALAVRI